MEKERAEERKQKEKDGFIQIRRKVKKVIIEGAILNEQQQNSKMKSILKGNEQNTGRRQQNRVSIVKERREEVRGSGPG